MSKKKNRSIKNTEKINSKEMVNGIQTFTEAMMQTPQISKTDTVQKNNRYNYIFNNRLLLNEIYIEHGLVQTLIDVPVDDGFRGGLEIKSKQLDEEDIEKLEKYIDTEDIYKKITQTLKWGRLFGGSGLVILTNQEPHTELDISKINKYSSLDFYPADLWELNLQYYEYDPTKGITEDAPYLFYSKNLHKSRVLSYKGKEAPSMMRRRFRGWGMTEVERLIRSFNQYLKNNDVIFDLLDEAKLDIYKLENYNASMISNQETAIQNQIQMSNMLKNYLNALVMDKEDDYEQKQVSFQGLAGIMKEIRIGVASDLKIPVTKLFGVSSTGFNSGEDDIENYNAMITSEVRDKSKPIILPVLQMICQKIFGFVPEDISIDWKPLRILSAEQEENVKDAKANRLLSLFGAGLATTKEAKESINKDNLMAVDVEVNDELSTDGFLAADSGGKDNLVEGTISTVANPRIADDPKAPK